MSRVVRSCIRIHQRQGRPDDVGKIVPSQLGPLVVVRREGQEAAADDTPEEQVGDDDGAARAEAASHEAPAEDGDDGDGPRGHGQQGRLLGRVPEALDDGGLVGADGAVGDRRGDGGEAEQPGLRVPEALPGLVPLEVLVLDARLVAAQALDGPNLLVARQEPAAHGAVGHDADHQGADGDGEEAEDEEHDLPARKGPARVVLEAEAGQGADDGACPRADVPQGHARRLFGLVVPHGRQEDQGRGDGRLEAAEQDAQGDEAGPVLRRADQCGHEAPEDHVAAEVLGCRQALHEVACGELEGEVGHVEDEG